MSETVQITFDGDEADAYERPKTLVYCKECDDYVLRSKRHDHDVLSREEFDHASDEDIIETQMYWVSFESLHEEHVRVEADNRHEARELAALERTYNGEVTETIHVEIHCEGEPSDASDEYLEMMGLDE